MLNSILSFCLRYYRVQKTLEAKNISKITKLYRATAKWLERGHETPLVAALDYWMENTPYLQTQRVFGHIDLIYATPYTGKNPLFVIRGWIFDVYSPIESVTLWTSSNRKLGSSPVWEPREDVKAVFLGEPNSLQCGFEVYTTVDPKECLDLKFSVRTVSREALFGYFQKYTGDLPSLTSSQSTPQSSLSESNDLDDIPSSGAIALVQSPESETERIKLAQAIDFLSAAHNQGRKTTLAILHHTLSSIDSLPEWIDTIITLRSLEEFEDLISESPMPCLVLMLSLHANYYCEHMLRRNPSSAAHLTLIDDSQSMVINSADSANQIADHLNRTAYSQIIVLPPTPYQLDILNTDSRLKYNSPSTYDSATQKSFYSQIITESETI